MRILKRVLFLAVILTVVLSSIAVADELVPLSNRKMLATLTEQGYHDMVFFQPSINGDDSINSSSESYLSSFNKYPVIGVQNDEIILFIMERQGNDWHLQTINNRAINRDNLSLSQFWMEESYDSLEFRNIYFQYTLENEVGTELTLTLMLCDGGMPYFSRMQTGNADFQLNYERGITLIFDFAFYGRYTFEVIPRDYLPFGADEFDFSRLPLSPYDLLEPAKLASGRNSINLFYFPDDSLSPVLSVESDKTIQVFPNYSSAKWNLAYYRNGFFFVHVEDLQPAIN